MFLSTIISIFSLFSNVCNTSYHDNMRYIDSHNSLNHPYVLEKNQFIDRHYSNGFYRSPKHIIRSRDKIGNVWNEIHTIPNSYDWNDRGCVTSVKNQGDCGSCWSFSSVEAMEGLWCIRTKLLFNLSEQELVDCSNYLGNQGCMGGYMTNGFQYVIDHGLCLNQSYPYKATDQLCKNASCTSVIRITGYNLVQPNNELILKNAVFKQPISVAIQANSRSFQMYGGGIYNDPNCGYDLDHGVLIVGYGYDSEINLEYWLVKNSWGTDWGENGYIRILRNYQNDTRGICGIAMNASFPILLSSID